MVRRSLRTRSTKKVKVTTPGGRNVTHFRSEKPDRAICGRCGGQLSGVVLCSATESRNTPASSKAPARPYAGVLCSDCLDEMIRYVTRLEVKNTVPDYAEMKVQRDLTIEKFLPAGWHDGALKGGIMKKVKKAKPDRKSAAKPKPAEKPKAKPKAKTKAK
jgi:large subunit ribosomal protein L34e